MAAIQVVLQASIIPTPTRTPASSGVSRHSGITSRTRKRRSPGTKMVFAGIKNEQEAKDLWAYLKQFDAQGNIKK
jgi:hypothetical protein